MYKRSIPVILLSTIILIAGCVKFDPQSFDTIFYHTYKDIPGVTHQEIVVIDELRSKGVPLIYAAPDSTEQTDWYAPLIFEWLTELFDIPFQPEIRSRDDVIAGLETGEIDFAGLVFNSENKESYFITDPVLHLSDASDETGYNVFSISIAAKKPELASFISIVDKALKNGGVYHLNNLYKRGYREYSKSQLQLLLNDEEKAYLRDNPVIPFAVQYFAYPTTFYNTKEKKWDGIIFDLFSEIEELTGLSFELVHDHNVELPETVRMLETGTVYMLPNLVPNEERKRMFLQSENVYMSDRFALLSKRNYPNVEINDIPHQRIGLVKNSAFTGIFWEWFPSAVNIKEYPTIDDAFIGLDKGEVDMVMSSKSTLTAMNNYYGFSEYKANFLFDEGFDFGFWFHKDHSLLCSVLDKAFVFVNSEKIVEQWLTISYNYEELILREQRPWLFGAIGLSGCVIILIIIMLIRSRSVMHKAVVERNAVITFQNVFGELDLMVHAVDPKTHGLLFMNDSMKQQYNIKGDYTGKLCYKVIREGMNGRCDFCPCNQLDKDPKATIVWEEYSPKTNRFYRNTSRYISWIDGSTVYFHQAVDITDMKQVLEQANAASRAKSDFLSNMSHEMRTPLNTIIGMTNIGKNAKDIDRKNYALGKISDASTHLLGVISDVLDMAKIEANKLELSLIEYDFNKMLQKVINVINFRIEEKNQKLTVNIDNNFPRFIVGDDQRLAQVITNLLSNAIKFTPEGGDISLKTSFLGEENGLCELQIEVADNGIGITKEQQARLFQAFEQAESGISREYGGTGLGLVISKRIVEMMGGNIKIESEANNGARFIFNIKAKRGDSENEQSGLIPEVKDSEVNTGVFAGKKMLLAEDIEINREIIIAFLENTEIEIDCAENGKEALDMIKAAPAKYDIVFMDVQMPKMDGLEATRLIRKFEEEQASPEFAQQTNNMHEFPQGTQSYNRNMQKHIPIIAMTANVFKSDIDECIEAGMNDHLGKPLDTDKLFETLRKYLKTQ